MLDLLGPVFKQASQGAQWPKLERARRDEAPRPPLKLAVCGPHRSPQVELGSDLRRRGIAGADFAMML